MRTPLPRFPPAPTLATDGALASAIGLALTGQRLPLDDPARLGAQLEALGFSPRRLRELRAARQAERAAWPFAVALEERLGLGFARFDAALAEARRELGLDGLHRELMAERGLNRDEQRLAADRPPHWG